MDLEITDMIVREGYPAYTTSAGWLGYSDDKMRSLCRQAMLQGWTAFKLKVGADINEDMHSLKIMHEEIGPGTVDTPSLRRRIDSAPDPEAAMLSFTNRQPMRRFGSAEENGSLAVYLASDEAAYTTGTIHVIDGRWTN